MEQMLINEELNNALNARSIELVGLERLIGFALSNTEYVIPQEKIDALMKKHAEVNAEYEVLKLQVSTLVTEKYGPEATWNLDFATRTVTVTK